jgi:hypothetical protein
MQGEQMFKKILGACVGLALFAFAGSAKASLMWEYDVFGSDLSGTGVFSFSTPSSSDDGAALTDFTFEGEVFGFDLSLDLDDVFGRSVWVVDSNGDLSSLVIVSWLFFGVLGSELDVYLTLIPDQANAECYDYSGASRCDGSWSSFASTSLVVYTPIQNVPEPGTLWLFLAGLGMLAFVVTPPGRALSTRVGGDR